MEWLVYKNSNEAMQLFAGLVAVAFILIVISANIYYWIKDKLKK